MSELSRKNKFVIFVIFYLSGFSSLVYEVLWTKHLSLAFGTTMTAVSIVAATFLAGLALGSYLLGRISDRSSNLLRIYAGLEMAIVVFALLFTPTLEIVNTLNVFLVEALPNTPVFSHTIHMTVSAALLLPPTICMGGTFPLMCRLFARSKSGGQIGRLYAANTFGAALGAFLCGYVLIPGKGLLFTNLLAVSINLIIAATAYALSKGIRQTSLAEHSTKSVRRHLLLVKRYRTVLLTTALIGFFSLAYEILWTRVFLLFLGNTSYAFSLILSSFLLSLALGGALYSRIVHPELNEKKLFVRLVFLMGLVILVTVPFYDQVAYVYLWAHEAANNNWWALSLFSGLIVFAVVSVPIVISGCLLPTAVAILNPSRKRTGEGVGLVVLFNTAGAVLGSLVTGFLLIPGLGIQNSFNLLGSINIVLSAILCLAFFEASIRRVAQIPLACALAFILMLSNREWNQGLMNSGVYIYASKYRQAGGIDKVLEQERIVDVIEGLEATVAVHESLDGRMRFFTVNGKTDGGVGQDMATQTLVGHLPMLLHPNPKDSLIIGLGTGVTLRGLTDHPTVSINCVEISPEVVQASYYFSSFEEHPLSETKMSLVIKDGRNELLTKGQQYDVIVSEPSNPWQSGNANLFTREFYELAASRLKPRGVFSQWIGIYDITTEDLRIAINTLLQTFPEALAFRTESDLIIVAAQHDLQFNYQEMQKRMSVPGIRTVLSEIEIDSPGELITKHFLFTETCLKKFSAGATLNTDNMPLLEYSAHQMLANNKLGPLQMANIKALRQVSQKTTLPLSNLGDSPSETIRSLRDLSKDFFSAGRKEEAQFFHRRAMELMRRKQTG